MKDLYMPGPGPDPFLAGAGILAVASRVSRLPGCASGCATRGEGRRVSDQNTLNNWTVRQ